MATGQTDKERELYREVSRTVTTALPGVEVLALEVTGRERFCVYVDAPGGVDHALCEQVSGLLRPFLDRYSIEVSSPGLERPLRRREHFAAAEGRPVRVKTADRKLRGDGRRGRRAVVPACERDRRAGRHTVRRDRAGQSDRRRVGAR